MNSSRSRIILVITLLLSFSLACVVTGNEEKPLEGNSADVIATSVAATVAAGEAADETGDTADSTDQAAAAAAPPPPEPNFIYAGVSFVFNEALADNIVAGVNPAMIDENTWWSVPEHREYQFNNWIIADAFLEARIKIYQVEEFKTINPGVGDRLDALQVVLATKPVDGEGAGVGDIFNAGQMYKSNVKYLRFQNGEGIRFLTQYGQALSPLGRPMMFYTFQGFTDDGQYYISAMLPATHPSLPHGNQVEMDQAFMDNWENYVVETEAQLNNEADNTFLPPLGLLDEMMESMSIDAP